MVQVGSLQEQNGQLEERLRAAEIRVSADKETITQRLRQLEEELSAAQELQKQTQACS